MSAGRRGCTGEIGEVAYDLATAQGMNFSYMCRVLRLTLLSPKIVEAVVDGRADLRLCLKVLLKPNSPIWSEQCLD